MDSFRALVVLTPAESKRLIAKGVAALPEVKHALANGRLIIGNGTTNAFVAEELLKLAVPKVDYAAGIVAQGKLAVTESKSRLLPFACVKGKQVETPWQELLREFEAGDVFIKGANAIDHEGIPGVLVASSEGGTVGAALGILSARGCRLIVPVGLEKLVPSVIEAAQHAGIGRVNLATGFPCALVPLPTAEVVTEIHALELLAEVEVWHVAAGGIAGSEGAVVLAIEGEQKEVEKAFALVESVKGEKPVS